MPGSSGTPDAGIPDAAAGGFDPFGWAARRLGERLTDRLIRAGACLTFAYFLARRIREYDDFLLKPLWAVETLIYVVLIVAFLMRLDPLERSRGAREILVPLAGGVLPFALLFSPPHPDIWQHPARLQTVFWAMCACTALTVWGMWTVRRAFSITVEARCLVTGGPYRWLRHPVYAGEMLTAAVVCAWRFSWINLAVLLLFGAVQLARARWEEAKLAQVFPEYGPWARRTWWVLPFRDA